LITLISHGTGQLKGGAHRCRGVNGREGLAPSEVRAMGNPSVFHGIMGQ